MYELDFMRESVPVKMKLVLECLNDWYNFVQNSNQRYQLID